MKWELICVLIISWLSIRVIGCWPIAPPPPPPPPPPLHLFEDHYLRFNGNPYERGLAHLASQMSSQTIPPMSGHQNSYQNSYQNSMNRMNPMNQPLFFPPIDPIPQISYSEPIISGQERLFGENADFDIGNTQEFVGYSRQREPQLMKVRHMNYRYRKRMKTQKPMEEKSFSHEKEVKFQNVPGQPKRYNVIDSRVQTEKKIPNSVNDKIAEQPQSKVTFDEEESKTRHQQNLTPNVTEKIDRKVDTNPNDQRDLQEKGSQTKDVTNQVKHPIDMPIEVTSYAMKSPNGAVTQVTEMLYDIKDNPFKIPALPTPPPMTTTFWKPSTPLIPITEDPLLTQSPYLNKAFSETETMTPINVQPINTAVTAKFNDITMSPIVSWSPREPLPSVLTFRPSPPPTTTSTERSTVRMTSVSPSDYFIRKTRRRFTTLRPPTTTSTSSTSSARESRAGLSGAAIAGIIIGSMVSIILLAGTSLFIMYKNPFRGSMIPGMGPRNGEPLPNTGQPSSHNTVPRV